MPKSRENSWPSTLERIWRRVNQARTITGRRHNLRARLLWPTLLVQPIRVAGSEAARSSRGAGREYRYPAYARGDRLGSRTASRRTLHARARRAAPHPASLGRGPPAATPSRPGEGGRLSAQPAIDRPQSFFFGEIRGLDDWSDWSETATIRPGLERREAPSPAASHARRPERERQSRGRDGRRRHRD
jgi:hypothetical protein